MMMKQGNIRFVDMVSFSDSDAPIPVMNRIQIHTKKNSMVGCDGKSFISQARDAKTLRIRVYGTTKTALAYVISRIPIQKSPTKNFFRVLALWEVPGTPNLLTPIFA